jgi:osmotically-inducible protein OsmY
LFGVVDNKGDRQVAEFRAREVSGVFSVENEIEIARNDKSTGE